VRRTLTGTNTGRGRLLARAERALSRPVPLAPLRRLLGRGRDARRIAAVANAATLVALGGALVAAALGSLPAVAAAVVVAAFPAAAVRYGPGLAATARRSGALGAAPALVSRAILRMRIEPTVEGAAAFAARTGDGPLAESLARHVRQARGTPTSGLGAFADEWGGEFPAIRRAALLVEAAGTAPPDERERALDRAMRAVLDGTRDRMASFAADLDGPATALYAFGVLLPLALVALLPAARVAGIAVAPAAVIVTYDVLLPLGVLAAGAWLLVRRPMAFPPRSVPSDHPDLPGWRRLAPVAGLAVAVAAWITAGVILPGWMQPLAAAGFGVGTALVVRFRPVAAVREDVRAVEAGLPDALYLVGRQVAEGVAVEAAVERAAGELDGETGVAFDAAARRGRQLHVGVREAFLGEHGALADVPSPRAESAVDLLALAAGEGRPAGTVVVSLADHLEELRGVERAARRELRRVTGTLEHTAAVFGPMVGGATVALAEAMGGRLLRPGASTATAGGLDTATLGLAVGAYVLVLSGLLAAIAAGMRRGLDPALVGYRAGLAVCSATATFLAAFAATGLLS
jgi:Flp pilus assembly protein TadB